MGRRNTSILITVIISTACLAPATAASGSIAAKAKPDPCALITSAAAGALAKPFTIESAEPISDTMCEYQLRGTGSNDAGYSGPVKLAIESLESYKIRKAIGLHKVKAVKGLGVAAYRAIDSADSPVVAFKTKKRSVALSGGLDAATLIALAKTFAKKLK